MLLLMVGAVTVDAQEEYTFEYGGKKGLKYHGIVDYELLIQKGPNSRGKDLKKDLQRKIYIEKNDLEKPIFLVIRYSNLRLGLGKDYEKVVQSEHGVGGEYFLEVPATEAYMLPALENLKLTTNKTEQMGQSGSSRPDDINIIYRVENTRILTKIIGRIESSFRIVHHKDKGNQKIVSCVNDENYTIFPCPEWIATNQLVKEEVIAFKEITENDVDDQQLKKLCENYLTKYAKVNLKNKETVKKILDKIIKDGKNNIDEEKEAFKKIENDNEYGRIEELIAGCRAYRQKFSSGEYENKRNYENVLCLLIDNVKDSSEKSTFTNQYKNRFPNGKCISLCIIGDSCDDKNESTIDDKYNAQCKCIGTTRECPKQGDPCDDKNELTINDRYNAQCKCIGTPIGGCLKQGNPCDDKDGCTVDDKYNAQCECIGTFQDSDKDSVCDSLDICEGHDDKLDEDGDGIPDGCDLGDPPNTTNVRLIVKSKIIIAGVEGGVPPYQVKVLDENGVVINNLGNFSGSEASFEKIASKAGRYTIRVQDSRGTFIIEEDDVYLSPSTNIPWRYIFLGVFIIICWFIYKKFIDF